MKKRIFSVQSRAGLLAVLLAIYVILCFLQRLIYSAWITAETGKFPDGFLLATFVKGPLFDLGSAAYLFLPLALLLAFLPDRVRNRRVGRFLTIVFSLLPLIVALNAVGFEFFFWEEFRARYNFIAVDYLVYTHEVVRNIWESYPVVWFFLGLFSIAAVLGWKLRHAVRRISSFPGKSRERAVIAVGIIALLGLSNALNEDRMLVAEGFWGRELSKNTLFALFSAYNRNSIDYQQFYVSMDRPEAEKITEAWLKETSAGAHGDHELPAEIKANGPEKRWNVVMVPIESMSARFMKKYGYEKDITPNLDRFADEGLFFSKMYATGSRTVRGLEALMLAVPPTPGQSILRRPNSDRLFNMGTVFRDRGYRTQFLYGGFAFFDNMGPWFGSNGFEIIDQTGFAKVTFRNAWGACDEDLFDELIRRADEMHAKGEKFFQVALTTSNHRPYTFPAGRIDLPHKGGGRDAAVKYTDFAIGRLVEEAKKKPWYKDTLFIFVADHNASVAGGTDLPIRDYLIPAIVHNPNLVKPQKIDKLASQIDLAPTVLALMNLSYRSWFFGQNLLTAKGGRALIGTYQKVGLFEPGLFTILEPGRRAQLQELSPEGNVVKTTLLDSNMQMPESVKKTAAIYQVASELFREGATKEPDAAPAAPPGEGKVGLNP